MSKYSFEDKNKAAKILCENADKSHAEIKKLLFAESAVFAKISTNTLTRWYEELGIVKARNNQYTLVCILSICLIL